MSDHPHKHKRRDYRCPNCGRLAFRAYLGEDTQVQHRCAKCGQMLVFKSNGKEVKLEMEVE